MSNEYVYFSKPKENKWNLKDVSVGDIAIIYSNDMNAQQFSDRFIVEIIDVDEENKSVKIKMYDNGKAILDHLIDLDKEPIKDFKNSEEIYSLPFCYLVNVKHK